MDQADLAAAHDARCCRRSFAVDISTGGNDKFATRIWLNLVPLGTDAPICFPCFVEPEIPLVVTSRHIDRGPPVRMLDFADFTWSVKRRDFPAGPGGNFFSDRAEDVWVDEEGLHMTVTMRDGDWYASEVILNSSLGYGTYIFQTRGRVDVHDPNLVAAGFLWDGEAPPSFRELDFEFTRWSLPQQPTNAQFVVQPCNQCPGCGDNCERFTVNLADGESDLTHYLIWSEGSVEFRTYLGEHRDRSPPASDLVHKWVHSGEDVPEPGNAASFSQ